MATPWLRALAVISFPTRPGELEVWDCLDLAQALGEVGRAVAIGQSAQTGTIIIPYQRRTAMKVSLEVSGPDGWKYDNVSTYSEWPTIQVWELASKAIALANLIANTVGQATDSAAAYAVAFHVVMDGKEPKLPPDVKGQVKADRLLFSQATTILDFGVAILADLQKGAHMEIVSGQRT